MSNDDRERWNQRYQQGEYGGRFHASALLSKWVAEGIVDDQVVGQVAPRIKSVAWDVACGSGRNCVYLCQQGFSVVGMDIADVGLQHAAARLASADCQADLISLDLTQPAAAAKIAELHPSPHLILVSRYLNLPLLPMLAQQLAPGGRLIVEVHLQPSPTDQSVGGPKSNKYRVAPGALRAALAPPLTPGIELQIEQDYEGPRLDPDGAAMALAQLVVRRL